MNSQLQNKLLRDTLLGRNKIINWALKSVWRILSEGEADCFIDAKGEKGDFDYMICTKIEYTMDHLGLCSVEMNDASMCKKSQVKLGCINVCD